MLFKSGKSASARKTITISYCIVLLLPLLFGVMLYGFAIEVVREESTQMHEQILAHLEDTVNVSLGSMNSVLDSLVTNYDVTYLAKQRDFTTDDYWKMHAIQDKLRFARLSNNDIDDILIYFHGSDTLLGSQWYLHRVCEMEGAPEILGMSVAELTEQLQRENTLRFFIASSAFEKPFLIRSNAAVTTSGEPTITFLIRLSKETLCRSLRTDNAVTFLFDGDGHFLCTGEPPFPSADILAAAGTQRELGDYSLIDHPASLLSMRYVRLMPRRIYVQDVYKMQRLLLVYGLICLLLGIPLVRYMTRRSYRPIQQIVSILPQLSTQQDADEFSRIEQSLTDLIRRNKRNESILDRQTENVKSHLMHKIIRLGDGYAAEFTARCEELGVRLPGGSFLLAAIDVEDGSSLFFENRESVNHEMAQVAFFAVSSISAELLGEKYPFFMAEYNGLLLTLVSIDDTLDRQHVLSEMRTYGHELFSRMQNDFCVRISLSISDIHTGYDGVCQCYQEIEEIVYRRDSEKTEPMLFYRDLRIDAQQAVLEKEAILAIRSHAYAQARDLLKQACRAQGETAPAEELPPPAAENRKPIQEILAYIDANYADPNLSIAAIAEQFSLSPSYFSLYFKRNMDCSPLDYVNAKRTERVKQLLAGDLPIKTIAHEVGYFDTRPMIRYFKRSEGVTPAEYREKLQVVRGG